MMSFLRDLTLASLYVPLSMASSISCIFFKLSSPSACTYMGKKVVRNNLTLFILDPTWLHFYSARMFEKQAVQWLGEANVSHLLTASGWFTLPLLKQGSPKEQEVKKKKTDSITLAGNAVINASLHSRFPSTHPTSCFPFSTVHFPWSGHFCQIMNVHFSGYAKLFK